MGFFADFKAKRADKHSAVELAEYNAYLERLAAQESKREDK